MCGVAADASLRKPASLTVSPPRRLGWGFGVALLHACDLLNGSVLPRGARAQFRGAAQDTAGASLGLLSRGRARRHPW